MNKGLLRLHKQLCKENPGYCVLVMDKTTNRYTTFGENAKQVGKVFGSPLVGNIESVSFERATLDTYLYKLVQAGLKVAICENGDNKQYRKLQQKVLGHEKEG